jgi:type III secretion system FlhB-like substrate exporter
MMRLAPSSEHELFQAHEVRQDFGHGAEQVRGNRVAEIGQTIPAPLFGAVAEVLAYLVRIKQLML